MIFYPYLRSVTHGGSKPSVLVPCIADKFMVQIAQCQITKLTSHLEALTRMHCLRTTEELNVSWLNKCSIAFHQPLTWSSRAWFLNYIYNKLHFNIVVSCSYVPTTFFLASYFAEYLEHTTLSKSTTTELHLLLFLDSFTAGWLSAQTTPCSFLQSQIWIPHLCCCCVPRGDIWGCYKMQACQHFRCPQSCSCLMRPAVITAKWLTDFLKKALYL